MRFDSSGRHVEYLGSFPMAESTSQAQHDGSTLICGKLNLSGARGAWAYGVIGESPLKRHTDAARERLTPEPA